MKTGHIFPISSGAVFSTAYVALVVLSRALDQSSDERSHKVHVNCERNRASTEKERKKNKKRGLQEEIQETDACVAYRDFRNVILDKLQQVYLRAGRAHVLEIQL
jgi:hypothetical protein